MTDTKIDPYGQVQLALDEALAAPDPATAAAARQRAALHLARVAAGPDFDMRRHRAISNALRAAGHGPAINAPIAPLTTR